MKEGVKGENWKRGREWKDRKMEEGVKKEDREPEGGN